MLTASEEGRSLMVTISVFICSQSALNLARKLLLPAGGFSYCLMKTSFLIEHFSTDNAPLAIWNVLTQKRRIVVNVPDISTNRMLLFVLTSPHDARGNRMSQVPRRSFCFFV